jgi:hypothetical protein
MLLIRVVVFILGFALVVWTLLSTVKTFVLPRSASDTITRLVFLSMRLLFNLRLRWAPAYPQRDAVMAYYAPLSLLALLPAWLILILSGYTAMFWAVRTPTLAEAYRLSGSSLLTLGFSSVDRFPETVLSFSEATIGLLLVALLIAYLPTMYAAFARREAAVTLLEVRAGSPPAATEMIKRFRRIHGLDQLHDQWLTWENWFVDIAESHSSLPALVFFRSPKAEHSWVTAAGTVLDAAALVNSTVDVRHDPQADLCLRAGYLALRVIADNFGVVYNPNPGPADPISITRLDYDAVCAELARADVPLKADLEKAWKDFAGWRVNYDTTLLALAGLTMAPRAPWSSDRATTNYRSFVNKKRPPQAGL